MFYNYFFFYVSIVVISSITSEWTVVNYLKGGFNLETTVFIVEYIAININHYKDERQLKKLVSKIRKKLFS